MGKLSDLWARYKTMDIDDPDRKRCQEEINKIEAWMIQKGHKKDGLTVWRNHSTIVSDSYPTSSGAVYLEDINSIEDLKNI